MVERMGVDTALHGWFHQWSWSDGANAGDDKKKAAYCMGIQIISRSANQMVKGINPRGIRWGFCNPAHLWRTSWLVSLQVLQARRAWWLLEQAAQVAQAKMMAIKAKNMEKEYEQVREKLQLTAKG